MVEIMYFKTIIIGKLLLCAINRCYFHINHQEFKKPYWTDGRLPTVELVDNFLSSTLTHPATCNPCTHTKNGRPKIEPHSVRKQKHATCLFVWGCLLAVRRIVTPRINFGLISLITICNITPRCGCRSTKSCGTMRRWWWWWCWNVTAFPVVQHMYIRVGQVTTPCSFEDLKPVPLLNKKVTTKFVSIWQSHRWPQHCSKSSGEPGVRDAHPPTACWHFCLIWARGRGRTMINNRISPAWQDKSTVAFMGL